MSFQLSIILFLPWNTKGSILKNICATYFRKALVHTDYSHAPETTKQHRRSPKITAGAWLSVRLCVTGISLVYQSALFELIYFIGRGSTGVSMDCHLWKRVVERFLKNVIPSVFHGEINSTPGWIKSDRCHFCVRYSIFLYGYLVLL